jgi:hypothetical protein
MQGWIKLHRQILDSRVFVKPELLKLWVLCLCKANHKKNWLEISGLVDPIKVMPGEFITGRYSLHKDYYTKKTSGMKSELTLWRWLQKLEKWGNLNINSNSKYTLVKVVEWEKYQKTANAEQQFEHQMNNRCTTDEHQMNTDKNDKKDKNDEKGTRAELHPLQEFVKNELDEVSKLKTQLTKEDCEKLISDFGRTQVHDVLLSMENYNGLTKKYKSVYLTAHNWCKRRNKNGNNNAQTNNKFKAPVV